MLLIMAVALCAAMIKMHMEQPSLRFRLSNSPPASVWTRLIIGHSLTGIGLTFGTSRLYLSLRKRASEKSFGHWLWITISLYLLFYISASLFWSMINLITNTDDISYLNLTQVLGRVLVLTSQQACFDQFAWLIAGAWISSRLLHLSPDSSQAMESDDIRQKSDTTIAIYSGIVIASTLFQRGIESAGY